MSFSEKIQKERERKEKEIKWIGASEKEFRVLPSEIKERFIKHLELNQKGEISAKTKSFPIANGYPKAQEIFEIKPAHRLIFIEMKDAIYVLHAFTKSSNSTPNSTQELIVKRYKMACHASEQARGIIRR